MPTGTSATLNTRTIRRELKTLKPLGDDAHPNARYMKPEQFRRLVENIQRDGVLTSAPLVARIEGEGDTLWIVSGNHRTQAAIKAGIAEADVIEVMEPLTRERFVALQLAHNAIEGEDDPNVLKRLYDELPVIYKEYTGLTDDDFSLDDLDVVTISGVAPLYTEVVLSFLGDESESVTAFIGSAEKWAKKFRPQLVADHDTFDRFFATIVEIKDKQNITNSATALNALLTLARERMDQIEAEGEADSEQ